MIIFISFVLEYNGYIHYNASYRITIDKLKNRGVDLKSENSLLAEETKVEELQLLSVINFHFRQYEIKTVKDLLNFTGGDFTFIRGVGEVTQRDIERKISRLGIDTKTFLAGSVWNLELPNSAKRIFVQNHIIKVEDFKEVTIQDILQMLESMGHRYPLDIIKKLQNTDIAIGGNTEELISDTNLPARIKTAFYRRNYYFLSQVLHLTDEEFLSIRELGGVALVEFKKWMIERENNFESR